MTLLPHPTDVAIACGGTGGHLFPGIAVAHELTERGAKVTLMISPKEVDQRLVSTAGNRFEVATLPLTGFSGRRLPAFLLGTWKGYREASARFTQRRPVAILAMGGFTAAAPVLAGRRVGALVFLHESNAFPGRANRWLARWADRCFVGFPEAADHSALRRAYLTGTPVRPEIRQADRLTARQALGLAIDRPVLLVTGGSQGARGVNQLMLAALPEISSQHPELQFVHLTGSAEYAEVVESYRRAGVPALVYPFSPRMDQLLAAATVVVSRSGASSLAELAARRLPAVLIPYPSAADDHQRLNAQAFVRSGAALMLDQTTAGGPELVGLLHGLLGESAKRESMASALGGWDSPEAAGTIAEHICRRISEIGAVRKPNEGIRPRPTSSAARLA